MRGVRNLGIRPCAATPDPEKGHAEGDGAVEGQILFDGLPAGKVLVRAEQEHDQDPCGHQPVQDVAGSTFP